MIVVADTSPVNYLILLGHQDILQGIFGRVVLPIAVLRELRHPDAPEIVSAWAAEPPAWLDTLQITTLDTSLPGELGVGEREAISLSIELRADILLIDEFAGRREAEKRQLVVTGMLAILLQAGLRGYLDFPLELSRLRHLGFRCSARLTTEMLVRYREALKQRG